MGGLSIVQPPPFIKGGGEGSDFSKIAVMGGSKIFTRNGGGAGMVGLVL